MEALFRLFGNICRLKQGPEAVPSSINLFMVLLLGNFVVEILLSLTVYTFAQSSFVAAFSVFSLMAFTWIWLFLFRLLNRYLQTITTLVGVNLFTNLVCFIPVTILWNSGVFADDSYVMINLFAMIWLLSIYAHIFRAALNISFFAAFAVTITYFITIYTFIISLSGV